MKNQIINKIENQKFVVGVIGLGYVGLPLALCFAEKNFSVIGFDVDEEKVAGISNSKSYIKHIYNERISFAVNSKKIRATNNFSELKKCNAILIAVPTPLNKNREPEMKYIISTAENISKNLQKGQLVVLESTTYPGTTEEILIPILEKSGLKCNKDFFVAFSPEREDPNNPNYKTETIPKVVGSNSKIGLELAEKLYQQIVIKTVPVSSLKTAEATKLVENIFRSVNIALVNELKMTFDKMGIDIWEVIDAAKTKPFGFMPFYPGPGLGGHCIPIDPFYLTWKAREYGEATRFIELAGEINTSMPDFVIKKVSGALNKNKKSINGSKILILGLAYKANVDDYRESPSFELMKSLKSLGANVYYNDPHISIIGKTREYSDFKGMTSSKINDKYDLILIATAHDEYKKINFSKFSCPVVDTRNIAKGKNVIKA